MSYQALFGAFPIAAAGTDLNPKPDDRVGELRASSRNGALFRALGELLDALPDHEALRFLAVGESSVESTTSDHTRWTVLDREAMPPIIAALDDFLRDCHHRAADVAGAEFFKASGLTAAQVRDTLSTAKAYSDVNAEMPSDDGDDIEFLFATLLSLRGLLGRAHAHAARIALFTWSP